MFSEAKARRVTQFIECRRDGLDLFPTHVTAFAGMRVKTTDINMRFGNRKLLLQITMQNRNHFMQTFTGYRSGHIF